MGRCVHIHTVRPPGKSFAGGGVRTAAGGLAAGASGGSGVVRWSSGAMRLRAARNRSGRTPGETPATPGVEFLQQTLCYVPQDTVRTTIPPTATLRKARGGSLVSLSYVPGSREHLEKGIWCEAAAVPGRRRIRLGATRR